MCRSPSSSKDTVGESEDRGEEAGGAKGEVGGAGGGGGTGGFNITDAWESWCWQDRLFTWRKASDGKRKLRTINEGTNISKGDI